MPIRVSNLSANTKSVAIDIDGETLNITYRPSGMTPETEDRLHAMAAEKRGGASLIALLVDVLASWDLLGDDDQPYPISVESLSRLPTLFLSRVAEGIMRDIAPNLPSGGVSAAGSLPRER